MVFLRRAGIIAFFSVFIFQVKAQVFNPRQIKLYRVIPDTLVLDSLSLAPGSVKMKLFPDDSLLRPKTDYRIHALIFGKQKPDSILVSYQRFPYNFEKLFFHKDQSELYTDMSRRENPFTIRYNSAKRDNLLHNDGLSKNGSISRGISFGNNQDVVVNSNLNLQVSGKLTPEIDLLMAATDNNIPFQADGTTAQLQEFDKVFIQLSNESTKLIVGDYQLSRPKNSYFMSFYKRAQGFYMDNVFTDSTTKRPLIFKTQVAGAVSRGKFSRQVFFGTESNQGPYRLRGADNEPFIIVLSGTERIYIDGRLLERGQENDYIIDYNTGELTFTAKQLITKDKRIVAEFQYAERNYARSLFFFGEELGFNRGTAYFNFFSEQDNRNRPLQQTLSQEQKNVLIETGDSLQLAYSSGVEEASFNNNDVFYRRTDTLVAGLIYPEIYVKSSNPELARYRLRFSNVGTNRGNYVQVSSAANGRVYLWIAPQNGVPQGSYEPLIPLVTPRQQQMLTSGFTYSMTQNNTLGVEGVYTKNDINRFSSKDKGNDEAGGMKLLSRNQVPLKTDTLKRVTKLVYNVGYEYVEKQFTQVERFRSIEFDRDWNRPLAGLIFNDQHIGGGEIGLLKDDVGSAMYTFNQFTEGNSYKGVKHGANAGYSNRLYNLRYNGSFLESADSVNRQHTEFYRHRTLIARRIEKIRLAYSDEFENNLFMRPGSRELLPRAYQFWEWEGSIANADSGKNNVKLFYRERRDKLNYGNKLLDSTLATNIGMQAGINSIRNHPFTLLITYRKLELKKVVGSFLRPDNTLLNRLEYNPRLMKGFITASVFYETGYGMENRREFYYLEVAPGQGQYAWNDYNDNGIRELNEFETAQFSDQARFIRIYTPTNSYVKVLQNQFSFSANLRPSALIKTDKGFGGFINRWALQTVMRRDNKIADREGFEHYNPFLLVPDTQLLAASDNVRQSIFFNQGSAVFGADYTYTDNRSRQLMTNGLEERTLLSNELRLRLNFLRSWAINSSSTASSKGNRSGFFSARNYYIVGYETEQRLSYQPSTLFRLSGIYRYSEKKNAIEGGFQQAFVNSYGIEVRYNETEKGSLTGRVDYLKILFNDAENSAVAYEMLNGLSKGDNYTWELAYQRNLNDNIQVSINYNGRKTPGTPPVHIGGAQVRAFF
jgi:hypothetical protein